MKKNLKRTLAKVMAVALTVSLLGTAADADAAKKPKLAKKSITVTKGKSKKVAIKNVKKKQVKKLTVKSSKKKVATVKKSGKTAIKVTGKKKGSAKITVNVTLKGKKKATKLTLKVKVQNAKKKVTPTAVPSTVPTVAPTNAPTQAPSQAPSQKPEESSNPQESQKPEESQKPDKPSTPAKVLPELNLREEAATEWSKGGSYGTATFNTDDTVDFNSKRVTPDENAENPDEKEGSVYNNGIAWYIDAESKGQVDLSKYESVELTIKTDAEIKMMTWGGSADAASFWDKNDAWGASTKTVENEDGSKTYTYPLEAIYGNATKVKKATAIGLTLKSDLNGDDKKFSAREAKIYGIKFIEGAEKPPVESLPPEETGKVESNPVETTPPVESTPVDTGSVETGSGEQPTPTEAPTPAPVPTPLATLDTTGYYSFEDLKVEGYEANKQYTAINVKIKAYDGTGELITKDHENYGGFPSNMYSKLTVGTEANVTNDNGVGYGDGVSGHSSTEAQPTNDYAASWGSYMFQNLGKYGTNCDDDGYFTLQISLQTVTKGDDGSYTEGVVAAADYDGFGFQTTSNATVAGVPKIEIWDVTFTE